MENFIYNIDTSNVDIQRDLLEISGWVWHKNNLETQIRVELNGNTTLENLTLVKEKRPDVVKAYPTIAAKDQVGFRITLPNLEKVASMGEYFEVTVSAGKDKLVLYKGEFIHLFKDLAEDSLLFAIDDVVQNGDLIDFRGWALSYKGSEKIMFKDEENHFIEALIDRQFREDVAKAYQVKADYKYGFYASVKRSKLTCKKLILCVNNSFTEKKYELDLKRFDFEHSHMGRLWNFYSPKKWKHNLGYIKENGFEAFTRYAHKQVNGWNRDYNAWIAEHKVTKRELKWQAKQAFEYNPLISIVIPLYNTPLPYLKELLDSLQKQSYGNFEVCFADGSTNDQVEEFLKENYKKEKRIKYKHLTENKGISENTNQALLMAEGEFIMLSDHDDVLELDALYEIVKLLNEDRRLDIVYTDEDKVNMEGKYYFGQHFKPDFNIQLLRCNNYICHIFVVRKSIVDKIGPFNSQYDGAQDYDFILRCCEQTKHIGHVAKSLYHWRAHQDSTAGNPESKLYAYEAGTKALQAHYERCGIKARVERSQYFGIYRSIFEVIGEPLISIIILNKDHIEDLKKCITSIMEKSTYQNFEIIIAENNSTEENTFAYYKGLEAQNPKVRVVYWPGIFNYAAINNFAVKEAKGDYYLFLNNDIEVITPEWMEEMLGFCQQEGVGIVGAKLLYPDNTVQHGGVILGLGGVAGHIGVGIGKDEVGYCCKAINAQNLSAVTAACMLVKKQTFEQVEGFDEGFEVAFNDVDFCMKVRALDQQIVFNPNVMLYHYESKSRGLDDTVPKRKRFRHEVEMFHKKWGKELEIGDPFYNKNLTLDTEDCSMRW